MAAPQIDISIRVYRFFRTFPQHYDTVSHVNPTTGKSENVARLDPEKRDEVHWVEYGPLGSDRTIVQARIKDLMSIGDMNEAQRNPGIVIAAARWEAIRPMYENWLKGIEPTAEGVPLVAWAGVEQSIVELLRMRGIHTVQQLARLNDTHIQNFGVPNLRVYIDNAKTYISTLDNQVIIEQLNQKDQRISSLEDDLAAMKEMLAQVLTGQQNGTTDPAILLDADLENDPAFDPPEGFTDPREDEKPTELPHVGDVGTERPKVETPSQNKRRARRAA